MLYRITKVEPRERYRLWIHFEDGAEGEVDLSDIAGKGVFSRWTDSDEFFRVRIDEESGTLVWPGGLDVAPDRLYVDVVGEEVDERSSVAG